ncbi:DUF2634 domain-containing protein [Clostridium thailandense]|uniref:DUF2634 domain-containing protein n=1 Tax=Clostridium thailandense TaxID=2794346 RepID=UPI003989357D
MIFPQLNINVDNVIDQIRKEIKKTVPKEYAWDFENNDFLLRDGKFVIVEGIEALRVWIWKALQTVRMKYGIYSDKYGHDLDSIVGKGFSKALIGTEAKRLTWECLSANSHILRLENFSIDLNKDMLNINFTAITDLGEVSVSV